MTGNLLIVIAIVAPIRIHRIVNVIEVVLVAVAFAAVVIKTVRFNALRLEILAILHGVLVVEIAHTAFSNLTDVRENMPTGNDTFLAGIYTCRIGGDGKEHGKHTIDLFYWHYKIPCDSAFDNLLM